MYSTAFWCLFVVLLFFLALLRNHCYSFHTLSTGMKVTLTVGARAKEGKGGR